VYLRIFFKAENLSRLLLPVINGEKESYGIDSNDGLCNPSTPEEGRKRVVVEFSSPNIANEFQGKHLRSTILGAHVSTMYQHHGWEVTKINYLGDWGKDMALLGVGWEKFGLDEAFEQDPIAHLLEISHKIRQEFLPEQTKSKTARDEAKKNGLDELEATAEIEGKGIYAERDAFFKRMEEGDGSALAFCKRIREILISDYEKFYARLGVHFDEYAGEAQVSHEIMAEIEQLLKEKGICEESGGAWVIDMRKHGLKVGTAMIRSRTGTGTYFLRYLAAIVERSRNSEFDKMVFIAADRTGHYSRLFKVLEVMGMPEVARKLEHVSFSDVSHMLEKSGHGHQPHAILDKCEISMLEALKGIDEKPVMLGTSKDAAKTIATNAVLAQELGTKRASDHSFDIKAMTSFKPGSGLYIQYWYARLRSLLRVNLHHSELPNEEYGELNDEAHTSLILKLGQFPEIVSAAYKSHEPVGIVTYLLGIIEDLSHFLDDNEKKEDASSVDSSKRQPEGEAEGGEKKQRLVTPAEAALYQAAHTVLENGVRLLQLTPPPEIEPTRADTPIAE
jgi:arginyl-tRNA synthetase